MFHRKVTRRFLVLETDEPSTANLLRQLIDFIYSLYGRSPMTVFTHPVGDSHLYQLAPLKTDGTPGATSTDVVYTSDNPTIASVTPNTGVAQSLQANIAYLTAGTANITATGTNEVGAPFSTTFQAVVTATPANNTDHFSVTEIS